MKVEDKKLIQAYYQALLARDPSYVGIFYVGVRTTSIFCIASCRAKKPKAENVEFFSTLKSAMAAGYRPCKICRPTENANEAPPQVKAALDLVRAHPKSKITDAMLRTRGLSPEVIRRWFKIHYGMTYQSFQRMYRINIAFQEVKDGKVATDAAFDSGYESLSGFSYMYKKVLGSSPSRSLDTRVILISRTTTPIGPMFICATDEGVCLLEFVDRRMLETEFRDLQRLLKARIIAGENDHIHQARKELEEYFQGTRKSFEVRLHTPGTDFQKRVWGILQDIPYGSTTSYQSQAESLGNANAVRAVASANGANRISILIPCHRVIGKDGSLTGYGGGLERKRWLIEHEKQGMREHKAPASPDGR